MVKGIAAIGSSFIAVGIHTGEVKDSVFFIFMLFVVLTKRFIITLNITKKNRCIFVCLDNSLQHWPG